MVRRGNEYEWAKLLYEKCWLDRDDADYYAGRLVKHDLAVDDLPQLSQKLLQEIGIHKMGHVLSILKYVKEVRADISSSEESRASEPAPRRRKKSRRSPSSSSSDKSRSPVRRKKRRSSTPPKRKSPKKSRHRSESPRRKKSTDRRRRDRRDSSSRSRSRSPRRRRRQSSRDRRDRRRSRSNENRNTVLERSRKEEASKVKLDDDDLLNADISLPARFRSKTKSNSLLFSAMSSGGQNVKLDFKPNKSIESRLGLRQEDTTVSVESGMKYLEIKKEGRAWDEGKGRRSPDRNTRVERLKLAEKPKNEVSVMQRLGGHQNNNSAKYDIEKVEHKESRHGKSHGMFALDDEEKRYSSPPRASIKSEGNRRERKDSRNERPSIMSRLGVRK